jgi:UPF0271 protein
MPQVDLNCDMGEGYPYDDQLMPCISSANIACGQHAGDEKIMKKTIELAAAWGVAAGAHPSFPDKENFGRKDMDLSPEVVYELVVKQVGLLAGIANGCHYRLTHVKPHGALYNRAARDRAIAHAIASAVRDVSRDLFLFGLSGSLMIEEARALGLTVLQEVFADRTYQEDGSLTPRTADGALIADPELSAAQALQMVQEGTVRATSGKKIVIRADTICLHGDNDHAPAVARSLRDRLTQEGILIRHW